MRRRDFLAGFAAALALPVTARAATTATTRLAAAWRGPAADAPQQVGVIDIDWDTRTVTIAAAHAVPGRAHGLLALPDGGFVAMAYRFGGWLWRFDAQGRVVARMALDDGSRRASGHVAATADGSALLATELDPRTGEGYVAVRDPRTLAKLDEWRCHGADPHHLLVADDGDVLVANGGVLRTPDDRKRDPDRMASSLVRLDRRSGALRGQWRLDDARLSLRHLAFLHLGEGRPLLGIALQAEHDDPQRRAAAPVLAVFDGARLDLPCPSPAGSGYAGDIAAAPGGFLVSCQPTGKALWWRYDQPERFTLVADLKQACALGALDAARGGVALAAAVGVARWHPREAPLLLPWPQPMALDNHWIALPQD